MEYVTDGQALWVKVLARSRMAVLTWSFFSLTMAAAMAGPAAAGASDSEARDFFVGFLAAQNAHDTTAVGALLWNSPDMLWFTRGVEVRGAKAIIETLKDYHAGTWHLEPDMAHFRSTAISDDVVQILVPITFTRGLAGKPSQDNTFLISQTLIRSAGGWRVAAIMPIANTQFK